MNLQEHIRRILKEENEVRGVHAIKTLSDLLLKDTEMYCGVKIIPPSKTFNKSHYQVRLYFIGGVNTKYWPRTQAIIDNELDILLKVHTTLKTTLPYNISFYIKYINSCDETDINRSKEMSEEEELDEYARTLKNARQQGVGLRFPKSAIKANPGRFRPYNR
jgi:hypothetical protein